MILEHPRQIYLTQDFDMTSFSVTVSRFQPTPDDITAYTWTDTNGNKREYSMPAFFVSDMAEARENMRQYLRKARSLYPKALLMNSNPIVWKTFVEAERYCRASNVSKLGVLPIFLISNRFLERLGGRCSDVLVCNAYD